MLEAAIYCMIAKYFPFPKRERKFLLFFLLAINLFKFSNTLIEDTSPSEDGKRGQFS